MEIAGSWGPSTYSQQLEKEMTIQFFLTCYRAEDRVHDMRAVVDEDQVGGEEEDGDHVAHHDLAVDVVELRYPHIHQERHHQEEAADDAADGVDESQGGDVALQTVGEILREKGQVPDDVCPV